MSARGKASKRKKRLTVWRKSGGVCAYCGAPLSVSSMTMDHVLPKSRGGDGKISNMVAACRACNEEKGSDETILVGNGSWMEDKR